MYIVSRNSIVLIGSAEFTRDAAGPPIRYCKIRHYGTTYMKFSKGYQIKKKNVKNYMKKKSLNEYLEKQKVRDYRGFSC